MCITSGDRETDLIMSISTQAFAETEDTHDNQASTASTGASGQSLLAVQSSCKMRGVSAVRTTRGGYAYIGANAKD